MGTREVAYADYNGPHPSTTLKKSEAHFIKEFRKFTGIKPSEARHLLTKNGEEFQQAVNIGF